MRLMRVEQAADRLVMVEEVGSTNELALRLAASGELPVGPGEVAVVAAERQTAGRGRLDHRWVSRPEESFTMSFVVAVPRPIAVDESVNGWLQMIAGLASLDAIEAAVAASGAQWRPASDGCGGTSASLRDTSPLMLKWPNDVFCDGRKLGGILCAMTAANATGIAGTTGAQTFAIVMGIGLNLAVPADRLPTAQSTSLQLHVDRMPPVDDLRDMIAEGLVDSLRRRMAGFVADPCAAAQSLRGQVESRCWTLGRRAVAHFTDGSELEGTAVALNADASLTLRTEDGRDHVVHTADVGVLPV